MYSKNKEYFISKFEEKIKMYENMETKAKENIEKLKIELDLYIVTNELPEYIEKDSNNFIDYDTSGIFLKK